MHLLLTDRLTCPRCGPDFGLILLADVVEDRRVLEGMLGCSNCREQYPVREGFADLRPPPRGPLPEVGEGAGGAPAGGESGGPEVEAGGPDAGAAEGADYWESLRLAALLGIEKGPGFALVYGPASRAASRIAGMVEELEVVAAWTRAATWEEESGVSRLTTSLPLPFYPGTLRGAILSPEGPAGGEGLEGALEEGLLEEAVRAVLPGGRVVVLDAPPGTRERLEEGGCEVLLEEQGVVVATAGRG